MPKPAHSDVKARVPTRAKTSVKRQARAESRSESKPETQAFIYLASASPRRAQLLDQIGIAHRPLLAGDDEDAEALEAEQAGELPLDYVRRVARLKLRAAQRRLAQRGLPAAPILCADTTVALGRRIFGKPRDAAHAAEMLAALAGRSHRVITAVALAAGRKQWFATSLSHVRFAPLPPSTIRSYVESGEPLGKAGAYAVQGPIAAWIAELRGSHSGVMGLPLHETAVLLAKAGIEPGIAARAARPGPAL